MYILSYCCLHINCVQALLLKNSNSFSILKFHPAKVKVKEMKIFLRAIKSCSNLRNMVELLLPFGRSENMRLHYFALVRQSLMRPDWHWQHCDLCTFCCVTNGNLKTHMDGEHQEVSMKSYQNTCECIIVPLLARRGRLWPHWLSWQAPRSPLRKVYSI